MMKEFFKKTFTKENLKRFFLSYIWLAVLIFIIDIVTKWTIAKHFNFVCPFSENEMIQIIPNFLYISLGFNEGMAWSLLSGTTGKIVLSVVSFVIGVGLVIYYVKNHSKMRAILKACLALIIAGAFGNFIDRAFYWDKLVGFTGVIDWIQVFFGSYAFPTFNIADSALVVGVIILIVVILIDEIKESIEKAKAGEYKYSPEELEKMKKEKENEANQNK